MGVKYSVDQVMSLAPDDASAKAGRGLAVPGKWPTLGRSSRAIWGECQGSGKKPYQSRIDMNEPAFKCSCPSRKFPCKHAIGLFLLAIEQPKEFTDGEPPAWVADWLDGRDDRRAKSTERAKTKAEKEVDPATKAKREAKRETMVNGGLDRLERWLFDTVAEGLAAAQTKPRSFWEETAKAMVDAQCPGLAGMVRAAESAATSGEGWQVRLLDELGRMWLLVRAARGQSGLPGALRADVRSLLGYTVPQEQVLAEGETVQGRWIVAGQAIEIDGHLTTQRTWLWAPVSDRVALVLDFAAGGRPLDVSLGVGTAFDGELAFYPSSAPQRALIKSRGDTVLPEVARAGAGGWAEALGCFAAAISANPWRRRIGIAVRECRVIRDVNNVWHAVDRDGSGVALSRRAAGIWTLLAGTGGHPVTLFGEWDGASFLPLSASDDGVVVSLKPRERAA